MNGILNINKPVGMTSHDIVNAVRKKINTKKVGHTGTLDPDAEGVLPLCIGKATRLSQYIIEKNKEYIAEIFLGINTDTFDKSGKITMTSKVEVNEKEIIDIFNSFIGEYNQIPPIYSAIKVQGKKLYEYAREGKTVEIKPRKVSINYLKIISIEIPKIKFQVGCSKGTYIRSLCKDIGDALNCGGHMYSLIRTKSGPFFIDKSIKLDDFIKLEKDEIEKILYPMDFPLYHLKKVSVNNDSSRFLLNGNILMQKNIIDNIKDIQEDEMIRLYLNNSFKGLGIKSKEETIKPIRIF